ncbi:MAG TPA: YbaK/EbsC family protein [Candidatus Dormibacteraeota bacterium]|nr:YbaK/EbsC family protein [Candidatus Dormibacteraeota bacterium]
MEQVPDQQLPPSVQSVERALRALGSEAGVVMLEFRGRTAQEAADAIGCELARIAKSLIFVGTQSARPVLALVSGSRRADVEALAAAVGEPLRQASADEVRAVTGYAIGGVAPIGYPQSAESFIDESLLEFETVWAAAGHPHAVFEIEPRELVRITGAMPGPYGR